jgi:hypothetical protein
MMILEEHSVAPFIFEGCSVINSKISFYWPCFSIDTNLKIISEYFIAQNLSVILLPLIEAFVLIATLRPYPTD